MHGPVVKGRSANSGYKILQVLANTAKRQLGEGSEDDVLPVEVVKGLFDRGVILGNRSSMSSSPRLFDAERPATIAI